jgi:hypothetical protein
LKTCELCGIENPDEARFCMKCGKDMDNVRSSDVPPEMLQDTVTFTPVGNDEYARLAPTAHLPKAPIGDVASYKEAAAASAAAVQEQQEMENRYHEDVAQEAAPGAVDAGGPEISHRGVTADFAAKKQFCQRCGMANPYDQRFCKNCGSTLGEVPGGMADETFGAPPPIPSSTSPMETTTLADVSPSSAFQSAPEEVGRRESRPRRDSRERFGGVYDWGVREWLILTVATLVFVALIWVIFFGGFGMIFGGKDSNIHKAGATMAKLPSFQLSVNSTYEVDQGQYGGGGHVLFETPDRSAWELRRDTPGAPQVQGTIAVGTNTYSGSSGTWQPADPATSAGDVILMWQKVSGVEALPNENLGGHTCYHYKYRMDPALMKTVLGLSGQEGVSDAIMETWIDTTSFQVIHQSAQVFGGQINGQRTKITLVMDLSETGKPYGIKPPM